MEAGEEEIGWVVREVGRYLEGGVKRGDVLSAWSGLRPLVVDPAHAHAHAHEGEGGKTESLVRSHIVHLSPGTGLLTVAGGKWTTYRLMAEHAVDAAVVAFGLGPTVSGQEHGHGHRHREGKGCVTRELRLVGSEGWSAGMWEGLMRRYGGAGLEEDVARHLAGSYGDRAWVVCELGCVARSRSRSWFQSQSQFQFQSGFKTAKTKTEEEEKGEGEGEKGEGYARVAKGWPMIKAEVEYAMRYEYARTPMDVLGRRMRLAFLDVGAARGALEGVVDVMAGEMGWGRRERRRWVEEGERWLRGMEGGAG
jgi:glycerol-3-phosphate dehydrogenase